MSSILKLDRPLSNGLTEVSEEEAMIVSEAMMKHAPVEWDSDMDIISTALRKQGFMPNKEVKV